MEADEAIHPTQIHLQHEPRCLPKPSQSMPKQRHRTVSRTATGACDVGDWPEIIRWAQSLPAPAVAALATSIGAGRIPVVALAARDGHADYVGLLLARGASPRCADADGRSALSYAVACRNPRAAAECAFHLARAGACAYAQSATGEDAIFVCISRGLDVGTVLVDAGKKGGKVCGCGCGMGPGRSIKDMKDRFEGVDAGIGAGTVASFRGAMVGSVFRNAPARLGRAREKVGAIVRRVRRPGAGSGAFRRRRSLALAVLFGPGL